MGQCKCLEAPKTLQIEDNPIFNSHNQEQDYQIQRVLQPLRPFLTLSLPFDYSQITETFEDFSVEKNIPNDRVLQNFIPPKIENLNLPEAAFCKNYPKSDFAFKFDSFIYIGQWRKFLPFGLGIFFYNDGSIYFGYSANLNPHIYGKKICPDQSEYVGEYQFGTQQGKGTFRNFELMFEGEWDKNYPIKGKETWKDGTIYDGTYKNGKKHGEGIMCWKNGNRYEGMFEDDQFCGHGVYTFADGFVYEGEWVESQMHGKGKLIYPNQNYFEGQFINDIQMSGLLYQTNGIENSICQFSPNSTFSEKSLVKIDRPSIKQSHIEFKSVYF